MKKHSETIHAIGIVVALCLALGGCEDPPTLDTQPLNEMSTPEFSDEIKAILLRRIDSVRSLLKNQAILAAVEESNVGKAHLPHDKILELDALWRRSNASSALISAYLTNACAKQLLAYQETDLGVAELFVTDQQGLNVCQTNKTSDFYQADEQWWVDSYKQGLGHAFYGQIEYDESAQSGAISLYVPVVDQQTTQAIGVAKVVIDITSIKQAL